MVNFSYEKVVFTQNQLLLKNSDLKSIDALAKKYDVLYYKDFGLQGNPKSDNPLMLSDYSVDEVEKSFKEDIYKVFCDFNGRGIKLFKNNFLTHIGAKESQKQQDYINTKRHLIYEKLDNILKSPDEVNIQSGLIRYFKYYKGEMLSAIISKNKKDDLYELVTWYKVDVREDNKRLGFLVKKEG